MILPNILAFILLGGFTGLLSGYLGIGGGIVLVPILTEIFLSRGEPLSIAMTVTFATSLSVAVFTTGSSAWQQWRQQNLILRAVPPATAGAIFGGQLGAWLGSNLSGNNLHFYFGVFLVLSSLYMLFERNKQSTLKDDIIIKPVPLVFAGFITGVIAALFGLGGGILMVPMFILVFKFPSSRVAGTSSAIAFPIAISGVIGYLAFGSARALHSSATLGVIDLSIAIPLIIGTLLSAPFGAKLNLRFGGIVYRRIFSAILALIALRILLTHL